MQTGEVGDGTRDILIQHPKPQLPITLRDNKYALLIPKSRAGMEGPNNYVTTIEDTWVHTASAITHSEIMMEEP